MNGSSLGCQGVYHLFERFLYARHHAVLAFYSVTSAGAPRSYWILLALGSSGNWVLDLKSAPHALFLEGRRG